MAELSKGIQEKNSKNKRNEDGAQEWTDTIENTVDSQRIEMRKLMQWNRNKERPRMINETYSSQVTRLKR